MLGFIVEDIIKTFSYIPNGMVVGGGLCLLCYMCNRKKTAGFYAAVFSFGVYAVILSFLVFWERKEGSRDGISLILFDTMGKGSLFDALVVENLLLFIPFGALLPCIFDQMKNLRSCVLAGFLCSTAIELAQLFTGRGYCQLDDVVMNTLGAVCGWLVYRAAAGLKRSGER